MHEPTQGEGGTAGRRRTALTRERERERHQASPRLSIHPRREDPRVLRAIVLYIMAEYVVSDVPPDRARLSVVRDLVFDGVSAALLPNGTLVCGAQADAALDQRKTSLRGLVLIHSHRQRLSDFRDHARALALGQSRGREWFLHGTSLMLINNNAPLLYQRASYGRSVNWGPHADDTIVWLRAYGALPLQIRLLLTTSLNFGYFCGELQALAAAAPITRRFHWVLTFSGPDVLPTPTGLRHLGELIQEPVEQATREPQAAFLYDPFPAQRAHLRVSMDAFVFRPTYFGLGASGAWAEATENCVRSVNRIPETIVAEVLLARNLTRQRIALRHTRMTTWTTKLDLAQPPANAVVWHVHNRSARSAWLDREEERRGMVPYDRALRSAADWPTRHAVCRTPLVRARNRLPSRRWQGD